MDDSVINQLLSINRQFYQKFAFSFSRTRQSIQPGVNKILARIPFSGNWLDLGCGNGALALVWKRSGRAGQYLGMDFSPELLKFAQVAVSSTKGKPDLNVSFNLADFTDPTWIQRLPLQAWDGILAFAVLHHIPSQRIRISLLSQIHQLIKKGSELFFSVWQFQHSPKLMSRRIPWTQVGLDDKYLEPGDSLLDWRAEESEPAGQKGFRYVHLFTLFELDELANTCDYKIKDYFYSDGKSGKLSLYQTWQVI